MPLDVLDDLDGGFLDLIHGLLVGVLAELLGRADDHVDAIDTTLDGDLGILHLQDSNVIDRPGRSLIIETEGRSRLQYTAHLHTVVSSGYLGKTQHGD